ncbi:hypothetical protein BDA96_04G132300 [Sorghum bicolor]|uniref:Uncharacterized protein n=1 Tax=Sorghum bicolor TaxID=4558 RepID=A0A921R2J3_SORBI|nr:hypothetical protein BDA96_04G132300 [Sorghum bicolor]
MIPILCVHRLLVLDSSAQHNNGPSCHVHGCDSAAGGSRRKLPWEDDVVVDVVPGLADDGGAERYAGGG